MGTVAPAMRKSTKQKGRQIFMKRDNFAKLTAGLAKLNMFIDINNFTILRNFQQYFGNKLKI